MKKILSFIIGVVSLSACSNSLTTDHNWTNKKWVLTELQGTPVQISGSDKDANLIFFANTKRFSGSGGCNQLSGSYSINRNYRMSFENPVNTTRNCVDQAFEDRFLQALRSVDNYTEEGNSLILKNDYNVVMRFQ